MKKQLLTLSAIAALTFGASTQVGAESYTVKSGDTLSTISVSQDISVDSLYKLNDLNTDLIHPGQTLETNKQETLHTVSKGENLPYIANTYGIPLTQLMNDNNLGGFLIHPGDELTINNAENTTIKTVPVAKEPSPVATPSQPAEKVNVPVAKEKVSTAPEVKTTPVVAKTTPQPDSNGKSFTVSATAYTAFCTGCSGTTRTGIDLRANPNQKVIAVDPTVIPLGSRVHVEGYGEAIAGDTGGAIKNNKIDVFIPDKAEALKWGRKNVKITILD